MKVVYDYSIFWLQRYGGITRYFSNLIFNLEKNQNINCQIISPFYKNNYIKNELKKSNIFGLHIKKPIPKTSFLLKGFNSFFFKHFSNNFKPNLIHSTYYNKNIIKKKPIILTVYDLIHENISLKENNLILPKKDAIKLADHIICISSNTKKDLLDFYNVDETKVSVIHLGSDHLDFKLENLKKNTEKPYILYVGSRHKYKNFNFFLESISKSNKIQKDFSIVLFGGGKLNDHELKSIKNLKLELNNFNVIEGDDNVLFSLYKNSRIFIFPSIIEGFGLPLLEAMACECPVLCSNNNTFMEIAGDSVEYFDPFDVESLKNKMEDTLYSDSRLKTLKKLGKIKSKEYSWEKCAKETFKIYSQMN